MYLDQLQLVHFRNHESFVFRFDQPQVVFVAPNGVGKTNILEAIYLLATGDTFREAKSEEMVNFETEVGHVGGKVSNTYHVSRNSQQDPSTALGSDQDDNVIELRVTLTRGMLNGKRVAKKRLVVNGVGRSKPKFVGNLAVVCFRPEDLRIIEGSPARRRKFLDGILSQIDRQYVIALSTYTKAIRQRNKLLEMIRERKTHPRALEYWDDLVIKHGGYINQKRGELINFFNGQQQKIKEDPSTALRFAQDDNPKPWGLTPGAFSYEMIYDHSLMSRERLDQYKDREQAAGYTLVGPHRDDFFVKAQVSGAGGQRDLAKFGSRGQQRMGVLWLKLQSLSFIEAQIGEKPVLLLDDIFSELDHEHRELVFELMQQQQTIATTADEHYVEGSSTYQIDLTE